MSYTEKLPISVSSKSNYISSFIGIGEELQKTDSRITIR